MVFCSVQRFYWSREINSIHAFRMRCTNFMHIETPWCVRTTGYAIRLYRFIASVGLCASMHSALLMMWQLCLSVCLSVQCRYCVKTVVHIDNFSIICYGCHLFIEPNRRYKIPPLYSPQRWRDIDGQENFAFFSTEIAVYLGKGMGSYLLRIIMGVTDTRSIAVTSMTLSDLESWKAGRERSNYPVDFRTYSYGTAWWRAINFGVLTYMGEWSMFLWGLPRSPFQETGSQRSRTFLGPHITPTCMISCNQTLQGDRTRWGLTFYRVHHPPPFRPKG